MSLWTELITIYDKADEVVRGLTAIEPDLKVSTREIHETLNGSAWPNTDTVRQWAGSCPNDLHDVIYYAHLSREAGEMYITDPAR